MADQPSQTGTDTAAEQAATLPEQRPEAASGKHDQGVLVTSGNLSDKSPATLGVMLDAVLEFADGSSDQRSAQAVRAAAGELGQALVTQDPEARMASRALIENGVHPAQVMEATGVSRKTAGQLLHKWRASQGEPSSPKGRRPDPRRKRGLELIETGKGNKEIIEPLALEDNETPSWARVPSPVGESMPAASRHAERHSWPRRRRTPALQGETSRAERGKLPLRTTPVRAGECGGDGRGCRAGGAGDDGPPSARLLHPARLRRGLRFFDGLDLIPPGGALMWCGVAASDRRRLPEAIKQLAARLLDQDKSPGHVAATLGVSKSTINMVKRHHQGHGLPQARKP